MAEKITKASLTRERLLQIALKEFNTKGFDQTNMRDLAKAADLSLGAFYYHFKSKEEIVQVYYAGTLQVFREGAEKFFPKTRKFEERLIYTLKYRIETFQENRELLVALSRAAVDPRSELSPFGDGTREIREQTLATFQKMLDGSDLKFDESLETYLPTLWWMYMMGIIFYWVFDTSKGQEKTFALIDKLTPLLCRLVRFSRYPFTGSVIDPIVDVLETLFKRV